MGDPLLYGRALASKSERPRVCQMREGITFKLVRCVVHGVRVRRWDKHRTGIERM